MKILILTSSTGGGHDMRAESLMQWTQTQEGKAHRMNAKRFQTLEETHELYNFGVTVYNWIQRYYPTLHHAYYNALEVASLHRSKSRLVGTDNYTKALEEYRPDILLSTHAHLNHGFFELAKEVMDVFCVTYCGELYGNYGFSKHWVNPAADLFIGAVPETCMQAKKLGMPDANNWCGGFLLKPKFYQSPMSQQQREQWVQHELGLDPDRPIIVLSTGANAAINHISFLTALHRSSFLQPKPQVVALCGRRKENMDAVQEWSAAHPQLPVRAFGHFDRMHELMECATAIVARPGTGTTSEAIQRGCPIIFNTMGGIMPQELITIKFARKHGFAYLVNQPMQLPFVVRKLIHREGLIHRIKDKMAAVRPAQTPAAMLERLTQLERICV